MPTPDRPRWIKPAAIGGAVLLGGAIAVGAATKGEQPQTQVPATETPHAASATPKPTDVIATPTGTFKVEVSPSPSLETTPILKILPPEFYSQARRTMLDINGPKVEYLVFDLPPGTPITAPIDGLLVKAQESGNLSGFLGQIRTPSGVAIFRGDIKFDDMLQKDVKKGDIIGHIGNTGVKIGNSAFNTAFTLTKITDSGPIVDEGTLKQSFPKAFEEPVSSIDQNPPGQPTVIQLFGSNPPSSRP